MKKFFLVILPLVLLVGCQSYPKNPSKPSFMDGYYDVNKSLPSELKGVNYTLVKYSNSDIKHIENTDNQKSSK